MGVIDEGAIGERYRVDAQGVLNERRGGCGRRRRRVRLGVVGSRRWSRRRAISESTVRRGLAELDV